MGLGLQLLKQIGLYTIGAVIFGTACMEACAAEKYPLTYEDVTDQNEPYMALTEDAQDYTVLPGDSLWKIAENQFGDGKYYLELANNNHEMISNPDLIYPGMVLTISQTGYIIRKEGKYGGIQMGEYSIDMPYGWTIGTTSSGNAGANFVMSGDGAIACLIKDKEKETAASVLDWEACTRQITDYAKENYSNRATELNFQHYHMENQKDATGELYLYSYIWYISPDTYPTLTCKVCVGLKLTDHIQAEFVGYTLDDDYDIQGCVRYVTASFEEHFNSERAKGFTVNNSNMSILPEPEWELEGMYDSFAYIDEFFNALLNKATGTETTQKSSSEKLIDRMSR